MSIPTVAVTCRLFDQNGNAVSGGVVKARLTAADYYAGNLIAPEELQATADVNGVATINLFPNEIGERRTQYRIRAYNPDTGRRFIDGFANVPNIACDLQDILVLGETPLLSDAEIALAGAQSALAQIRDVQILVVPVYSTTPPTSPIAGQEWVRLPSGRRYTWIVDNDSAQWVESGVAINATTVEGGALVDDGAWGGAFINDGLWAQ